MKKKLCIIASALALTIFAGGVLAGCNPNTASGAANNGKITARKIEATVNRLEVMNDKDFKFPAVFGDEFFSEGTLPEENNCPPGVKCKPPVRRSRYVPKHVGNRRLNREGKTHSEFLDKLDDLFISCADISSANEKCNQKISAIREEVKQYQKNMGDLRKTKKAGKDTYARVNSNNKQLDESAKKLSRDRNRLRESSFGQKPNENSVDVEAMTMRNQKIMGKVENRLRLLEDTHEKLVKQNDEIRTSFGKPQNGIKEREYKHSQPQNPRYRTLPYKSGN